MCPESYAVHFPGVAIETAQKSAQEWPCHQPGKRKAGRTEVRPYTQQTEETERRLPERSGAEEDGFALEHFDGDEEGGSGIHAGGGENHRDVIPVIGAGD